MRLPSRTEAAQILSSSTAASLNAYPWRSADATFGTDVSADLGPPIQPSTARVLGALGRAVVGVGVPGDLFEGAAMPAKPFDLSAAMPFGDREGCGRDVFKGDRRAQGRAAASSGPFRRPRPLALRIEHCAGATSPARREPPRSEPPTPALRMGRAVLSTALHRAVGQQNGDTEVSGRASPAQTSPARLRARRVRGRCDVSRSQAAHVSGLRRSGSSARHTSHWRPARVIPPAARGRRLPYLAAHTVRRAPAPVRHGCSSLRPGEKRILRSTSRFPGEVAE
jgi:hypothetical protein